MINLRMFFKKLKYRISNIFSRNKMIFVPIKSLTDLIFVNEDQRTIVSDLVKVKNVLINENNWSQRTMARNKNGEPTYIDDPDACKWCILGVMHGINCNVNTFSYVNAVARKFKYEDVSRLNDLNTHETILAFIDACLYGFGVKYTFKEIK